MAPLKSQALDDPHLLLSLVPLNARARTTFEQYSPSRYRHSSFKIDPQAKRPRINYKETTPTGDTDDEGDARSDDEPELQLSLDNPPLHPRSGYVFGSDPEKSDIYLGARSDKISPITFRILFTREALLVMVAESASNQLRVSYDENEAYKEYRYIWVLFREKSISVTLPNGIRFKFRFPKHGHIISRHTDIQKRFFQNFLARGPDLAQLNADAHPRVKDQDGRGISTYRKLYTKFQKLGEGGFGAVYKVKEISTGCEFAMKVFLPGNDRFSEYRYAQRSLEKEASALAVLDHCRIVRQYDHFKGSDCLCLVMDLLPAGDLHSLLRQTRGRKLGANQVSGILWQGLQALEYLHGKGITHRDLKLSNIMVEQKSPFIKVKLVDFGLSSVPVDGQPVESQMEMKTQCGTLEYYAPEQSTDPHYTNKVDIWALAVVIMYCLNIRPSERPERDVMYGLRRDKTWCDILVEALDKAKFSNADPIQQTLIHQVASSMLRHRAVHRSKAIGMLQQCQPFFRIVEQMEAAADEHASSVADTSSGNDTRTLQDWTNRFEAYCRKEGAKRRDAERREASRTCEYDAKLAELKAMKARRKSRKLAEQAPPPFIDDSGVAFSGSQRFSGSTKTTKLAKGSLGQKHDRVQGGPKDVVADGSSQRKRRR